MGFKGQTILEFGAFPGCTDAKVTVTGQSGILADSIVAAWLSPTAPQHSDGDEHSADEHLIDGPVVTAGSIVPGVGFTIYGMMRQGVVTSDRPYDWSRRDTGAIARNGVQSPLPNMPQALPLVWGDWVVSWVWN